MNEPDVANVAFPAWSVPRELILLIVITMAVFAPSLVAPFHLDDGTLLSDPIVTSPSGWWHVWRPLQTRPLTWFTFWINYAVFGENPTGWHATNVLLHAITVFLAYRLFLRVTISRAAAITGAALFALHPIQTEAVVYVFERATTLSTLFCLLSAEAWQNGNLPRAIGCFVFALLSKEECVLFPLFLLLLRQEIKPVLIMLALSVAAGLRVILAIELLGIRGAGSGAGISPFEYLLTQGTVILRYVRMLVLPHGFTCDPAIPVITDWRAYACWAAVFLAAGLVWKFAAAGAWVVAGLVLLLPSSSIFPAEDLAADRRLYLPMIAFAGFAALTLPITQKAARLCAAAAMLLFMVVTSYRVCVWQSEERLWAEAVQRGPEKLRPRILLSRLVDDVTAIRLLRDAKSNAPSDHRARVELGIRLLGLGDPAGALEELQSAVRLAPNDVSARNNLGVALLRTGQRYAAIEQFHEALRLQPCVASARNNLELLGDLTATATCGPAADSASAADPEGKVLLHQQAPARP